MPDEALKWHNASERRIKGYIIQGHYGKKEGTPSWSAVLYVKASG